MNAVVLAGGKMAQDNPLYPQGREGSRSLIDLSGRPMVQWVIDALDESDAVSELYVMGMRPESGLHAAKPMYFLPDQGSMFTNIRSGVLHSAEDHPESTKVLVASGDIPAIRPHMVDWLANQISADPEQMLYYNVITQAAMEARFPNAKRSYVRFKDVAVCGGDLNAIDARLFTVERPIWEQLTSARKQPLKQAAMIGFDTLLLVALRWVTLEWAVRKVCKRLAIQGKALLCPHAEMGMDADKPHQLAILRQDLEDRL